ncbi:hypothetical protein DENIS_1617 [Desulfonema ishimotonii]|uniref:Uncharacterized protein n=1 Tax=Desulfonema ishimotonii TaxID=45657 RepID=A0A401FUM6_9BACT|nr:DUF6155 family protein [Desulfonema ishimotonii]GBC60660.1 hypothetical protein DENIS_1617 [Desulfonema ishimotonii]
MKKVGVRVLKGYLKNRTQDDLMNEVCELFKRFDNVKEYYTAVLSGGDDTAIIGKYRKIIRNEFFPSRGFGKARLSVARKAVSDYKKVSDSVPGLADLMLWYVENGVRFTDEYGDIDEPFYVSMEGMYEKALIHITRHKLTNEFQPRCRKIVDDATDGWGFQDALEFLYEEYIGKNRVDSED